MVAAPQRAKPPTQSKARQLLGTVLDDLIRTIVREELETRHGDHWVDQRTSPLPRRKFLMLVRDGELPGRKTGRSILVRRSDVDAYIEAQPGRTRRTSAQEHEDCDELDLNLEKLGFVNRKRKA